MKPKTPPLTEQGRKFEALARDLGCDEDEEAFKAKVKKVATAPKQPAPSK